MSDLRKLQDLAGIGPAALADLKLLGVNSVADLAERNGDELYHLLCKVTGKKHDICCLDVFHCAVAQARDPDLSSDQRNWWHWSRLRKSNLKGKSHS
jgi:nucleotidyltransferase/DNA polymerase involved in DNA repair